MNEATEAIPAPNAGESRNQISSGIPGGDDAQA